MALHARGSRPGIARTNTTREWAEVVAASQLDVIEAFTPAPDTDMLVAEARAAWPEKTLWINFPSSLHNAPLASGYREYVDEMVRESGWPGVRSVGITDPSMRGGRACRRLRRRPTMQPEEEK